MDASEHPCSINLCPNPAVHEETAESSHWRFVVRYCTEHHREVSNGTPLGPLGLNASHVTIEPRGTSELRVPSNQASPVG
jgi:hypothetical protein